MKDKRKLGGAIDKSLMEQQIHNSDIIVRLE